MRGHVILDWELVTSKIVGLLSPFAYCIAGLFCGFWLRKQLFLACIWPSFTDIIHKNSCWFSATIDRANFGLGIFVCVYLRHILIVEFTIDILNRAIKYC